MICPNPTSHPSYLGHWVDAFGRGYVASSMRGAATGPWWIFDTRAPLRKTEYPQTYSARLKSLGKLSQNYQIKGQRRFANPLTTHHPHFSILLQAKSTFGIPIPTMWSSLTILPLLLLPFVAGEQLEITRHPSTDCFYSCEGSLSTLSFSDTPADATGYYAKMAYSNYFLTSLVACMEHYCTSPKMSRGALKGWNEYIGYALEYGPDVIWPSYESVKEGMEEGEVPEYDVINANLTVLVNETVIPNSASYGVWIETLVS